MDSRYSYYFTKMAQEERRLTAHGHTRFPDEVELVEHVFGIDDKIALICEVLGIAIEQDYRGRWVVSAREGGGRR